MKKDVIFKVLTYDGEIKYIVEEFELPDFTIIEPRTINGFEFPMTDILSQQIDYLDSIDKSDFMNKHDIHIIFEYEIAVKEEITFTDYIKSFNVSEDVLNDMLAVAVRIKDRLMGKSFKEAFELILSHLNIGYEAQMSVYESLKEFRENLKTESIESLKLKLDEYKN